MSYDAFETSADSGSPVELFEFSLGGEVFRYTSQTEEITINALTYTPLELKRGKVELTKGRTGGQLVINMPADNAVPRKYLQVVPVARMALTIRRAHRTDGGTPEAIVFWKGFVTNVKFTDLEAKLTCEPLQAFQTNEMPRRTYQSSCNFVLFDGDCALNRATFSDNVTVDSIDGDTLVLDSLSAARPADSDFYLGGFVERSNGDKRMILEYTFATDTVRILLPFAGIEVGETVIARAGCDRSLDTCVDKFANGDNFGGFAHVPGRNPFETGL